MAALDPAFVSALDPAGAIKQNSLKSQAREELC
jgi:hypothetical protein